MDATDPARPLHLVLCSDGTGNEGGSTPDTNVFKLYNAVDIHADEIEQRTFYDVGVGTSDLAIWKAISGAFGAGFSRNVCDLYRFLAKSYEPDRECRIFLFGFSRGAATVRAFTGFLHARGLVNGHEMSASDLQERVETEFERYKNGEVVGEGEFSADSHGRVSIHFVGVWDTVSALGAPKWAKPTGPLSWLMKRACEMLDDAINFFRKHRSYQYGLYDEIKHAYQALAIDDERTSFRPKVWKERGVPVDNVVEQVWFAGMHSNVGGGYQRAGLADLALEWMAERAVHHGLILNQSDLGEIHEHSNPYGLIRDSRAGANVFYRFNPRSIEELCEGRLRQTDGVENLPRIHESVFERMEARVDGYAPGYLPRRFHIVTTELAEGTSVGAATPVEVGGGAGGDASLEFKRDGERWSELTRALKDGVNRRKSIHSLMIFVALVALITAFFLWMDPPADWGKSGFFGHVADVFEYVLPQFFAGLIEYAVVQHPIYVTVVTLAGIAAYLHRTRAVRRMKQERAERRTLVLNQIPDPEASTTDRRPRRASAIVEYLASKSGRPTRITKSSVLLVLVLFATLASRSALADLDGVPPACRPLDVDYAMSCGDTDNLESLVRLHEVGDCVVIDVNSKSRWNASGLLFEKGLIYNLEVQHPAGETAHWCDASIWSSPEGWSVPEESGESALQRCDRKGRVAFGAMQLMFLRLAKSLSRASDFDLFTLMGVTSDRKDGSFKIGTATKYQARDDGEFCSYANDTSFTYSNNAGSLLLRVTRMDEKRLASGRAVRLSLNPQQRTVATGTPVWIQLRMSDTDNQPLFAPEDMPVVITVKSNGKEVVTKRVLIPKSETSGLVSFEFEEQGVFEIEAHTDGLLDGGTFIQVVPNSESDAEAEDDGVKRPSASLRGEAPFQTAGFGSILGCLLALLIASSSAASEVKEATDEVVVKTRGSSRARESIEVIVFVTSNGGASQDITLYFHHSRGELVPNPIEISRGETTRSAHLTSEEEGSVKLELVTWTEGVEVLEGKLHEIEFSAPIYGFKILRPDRITLVDMPDLSVELVDEQRISRAASARHNFVLQVMSGRGALDPNALRIESGEHSATAKFTPYWWGTTSIRASAPNLVAQEEEMEVGFPFELAAISIVGGLIGGVAALIFASPRRLIHIFIALISGPLFYWAVLFGLIEYLPRDLTLNALSVFFVAAVGGWGGADVFKRVGSTAWLSAGP